MLSNTFVIQNKVGLHARPAALFVQTSAKFNAKIQVKNVTRGTPFVDAKSVMKVMALAVGKNHEIEVTAEGEDEAAALQAIAQLIQSDFASSG